MNNANFDEYQIIVRQKIAFQTLIFTFALIFINGFVKESHIWAAPMMETFVLLYIPTIYFVTRSIFKNAYISVKEKNANSRIICFGIVALLNIFVVIQSLLNQRLIIIENGQLQNSSYALFSAIFFFYITIILIIKKHLDFHNKEY